MADAFNLSNPTLAEETLTWTLFCSSFQPSTDDPASAMAALVVEAPSPDYRWVSIFCGMVKGRSDAPALDEIFETLAPFDSMIRLIFQLGDWLTDNIGQQINQAGSWLHLGAIGRKWKAMLCNLEERYTQ